MTAADHIQAIRLIYQNVQPDERIVCVNFRGPATNGPREKPKTNKNGPHKYIKTQKPL